MCFDIETAGRIPRRNGIRYAESPSLERQYCVPVEAWLDADGLEIRSVSFFFYSNEGQEPPHIHVKAGGDEAKFWLDPITPAVTMDSMGVN